MNKIKYENIYMFFEIKILIKLNYMNIIYIKKNKYIFQISLNLILIINLHYCLAYLVGSYFRFILKWIQIKFLSLFKLYKFY